MFIVRVTVAQYSLVTSQINTNSGRVSTEDFLTALDYALVYPINYFLTLDHVFYINFLGLNPLFLPCFKVI